jgi:hypothetical protein
MGHDAGIYALAREDAGDTQTMDADAEAYKKAGLSSEKFEDVCYWRRHYGVADWMAKLYVEKGGVLNGEIHTFNNKFVRLSLVDIDRFERDLLGGKINDSTMLFNNALTLNKYIPAARSAIKAGRVLFYYASY